MRIKHVPEDFVVIERPLRTPGDNGKFLIYEMTKRDLTTPEALRRVGSASGVEPRSIGIAGLKDRRAVTSQMISSPLALLEAPGVTLRLLGRDDEPLRLGDHAGNEFRIVARDVLSVREACVLNYFGNQRFARRNVDIGLALMRKQFSEAVRMLVDDRVITPAPEGTPPVQALQRASLRHLLMMVHAVQSWLFNEAVAAWVSQTQPAHWEVPYARGTLRFPRMAVPNQAVPVVGAAEDLGDWERWYAPLLASAGITPASFVCRQIPGISLEGTTRSLLSPLSDLSVSLDDGVATVQMVLAPGAYATIVLAAILE